MLNSEVYSYRPYAFFLPSFRRVKQAPGACFQGLWVTYDGHLLLVYESPGANAMYVQRPCSPSADAPAKLPNSLLTSDPSIVQG
jgi:hypothetical protein